MDMIPYSSPTSEHHHLCLLKRWRANVLFLCQLGASTTLTDHGQHHVNGITTEVLEGQVRTQVRHNLNVFTSHCRMIRLLKKSNAFVAFRILFLE